jgi:chromate reductase
MEILIIPFSTRTGSFNTRLATHLADNLSQDYNVSLVDLKDFDMPIYNGDIETEQGVPETAKKLFDMIKDSDLVIMSSPEYNGYFPPLFKNTIDWISRIDVKVFYGKKIATCSASVGKLGGIRGLYHVRAILCNLGSIILPNQLTMAQAEQELASPNIAKTIAGFCDDIRKFGPS